MQIGINLKNKNLNCGLILKRVSVWMKSIDTRIVLLRWLIKLHVFFWLWAQTCIWQHQPAMSSTFI